MFERFNNIFDEEKLNGLWNEVTTLFNKIENGVLNQNNVSNETDVTKWDEKDKSLLQITCPGTPKEKIKVSSKNRTLIVKIDEKEYSFDIVEKCDLSLLEVKLSLGILTVTIPFKVFKAPLEHEIKDV